MADRPDILIIDDEEAICFAFRRYFQPRGLNVRVASTGEAGLEAHRDQAADVVFLDVRLPDVDGLEVLARLREIDPGVPVVVITAYGSLQTVTRAMRDQAFEYLVKPLDLDGAARVVDEALAARSAAAEGARHSLPAGQGGARLVGDSPAIQEVYKRIGRVAQTSATVLILGETGTGKDLVARAIHEHSPRRDGPFVAVNCGALPEQLVEGELFGYVRGAFTGADADKPGRFEVADGGTLFLDEVAELPLSAQVKLLRFLDARTVERLGSVESREVDVRVLAATNRDPRAAVEEGRLRQDLYYRLAVIQIEVPPLRDRPGDVVPLARHLLARVAEGDVPPLTDEAAEVLRAHRWPGNVRELANAMEHAAVVSGGGPILPTHFPETVRRPDERPAGGGAEDLLDTFLDRLGAEPGEIYPEAVGQLEKRLIRRALAATDGNQSAAAERLGVHRNTLRKKLRQLGISSG